jgi:type II secretory pathway component PulF
VTTFQFKAVTADGQTRTGAMPAENPRAAAAELKRQGLTPIHIGIESARRFTLPGLAPVSARDIRFFTQEMATLLSSGIPIDRALTIVSNLTEREGMRTVILDVLRILKGGKPLADSLAAHPKVFGELYVNMVRAGEAGGSLSQVFERMAEYERSRDDLRGYIVSSMVYPLLLAAVGLGSIFVLLYYVVPRFATMFDDGRLRMPLPTQIMLTLSSVTREYGLWIVAGLAAAALGVYSFVQTGAGRAWWHRLQLRIPLFGDAVRKAETARFARAMATLIANGVPLVQGLSISTRILTNTRISASLEAVSQGVKRGEGIAGPLTRSREFPPLAGHLLAVGEETGRLDEMFNRMADIYDADTRAAVKRFTSLFEPLLILIMGIIVGALILSMLLAITSINEVAI